MPDPSPSKLTVLNSNFLQLEKIRTYRLRDGSRTDGHSHKQKSGQTDGRDRVQHVMRHHGVPLVRPRLINGLHENVVYLNIYLWSVRVVGRCFLNMGIYADTARRPVSERQHAMLYMGAAFANAAACAASRSRRTDKTTKERHFERRRRNCDVESDQSTCL